MMLSLDKGDRVVVIGSSGDDMARTIVAVMNAGGVVVPANPSYRHDELAHIVNDCGARHVIDMRTTPAPTSWPTRVEDEVDVDDAAMLIYTSGTTGKSKGCVHTHRSLREGIAPLMALWGIGKGDVVINALPLFHVHGCVVAYLGPIWAGAQSMLLERFSPEGVIDAARAGGTVLMCVPTMVHRLVAHLDAHPDDRAALSSLRLVTCGSAPLSPMLLDAFRAHTGHTIVERYGMSETLITVSNTLTKQVPGAVGWPLPNVDTTVKDGELWVRGPGVMRGYYQNEHATREVFVDATDGGTPWLKTGDAVSVDDDGAIRVVGRLSQDILKVGGFKLSAREIEDACASHPAIAEVAIVGVPDDEWGERVCAAVVLRAAMSLSLDALQAHVQLAPVKLPRRLIVLDELPRTPLGKVQKAVLKQIAQEKA